jgi:GGDEF domain-containing protein
MENLKKTTAGEASELSIWDMLSLLQANGYEAWVDFAKDENVLCFIDNDLVRKIPSKIGFPISDEVLQDIASIFQAI